MPASTSGGSPVVALHSLFFDGTMFDDLRTYTGRQLHAPDHRGQGSRRAEGPAPTLDALADDVVALIEEIGEPVHLVGSSMGAYVSALAAARTPQLVRSCTLSAATGDAEQRPEIFAALVEGLRRDTPAGMVDVLARTMFGETFLASQSTRLHRWLDHFAALDVGIADAAEQVFARRPLWAEIEAITAPLLLLAGREDRAKSPSDMQRIADRTGCPTPTVLGRSGHTPFVEQPIQVAEALAAFWTTTENERKT